MRRRIGRLKESVRTGFWALPAVCILVALALAVGLVRLDRSLEEDLRLSFGAGPDGAREVLSAITSSMITFTGLVFSITIVVLQLTSSQFSPRVLRTFLRDRRTQLSLGVFVATFVYAVMVLRSVSGLEDDTFVPAVSTSVGVVLLLLSVAVFVGYIHHVATAIQVSSIIASIGAETREVLERRFPPGRSGPADALPGRAPGGSPPVEPPTAALPAPRSGVIVTVDEDALVRCAQRADVVLRTQVRLGDFVPQGAPLLHVHGDAAELDAAAVVAAVGQGRERTMQQDVAFGFRQLVDIAERALSPGVNDPTTAVQALDEIHDLLRRLATRPLRSGLHEDDSGRVRLVTPAQRLEDFLALALDEIEDCGSDARQVQARIDGLLDDVGAAALPEHRAVVERRRVRRRAGSNGARTPSR